MVLNVTPYPSTSLLTDMMSRTTLFFSILVFDIRRRAPHLPLPHPPYSHSALFPPAALSTSNQLLWATQRASALIMLRVRAGGATRARFSIVLRGTKWRIGGAARGREGVCPEILEGDARVCALLVDGSHV